MKGSYVYRLFRDEPAKTFKGGHVFINAPELAGAEHNPLAGYWHCDIANHDKLTWSEAVNSLFGLPTGTPLTRDWAVAHYAEHSKENLERLRTYALSRKFGFLLDVELHPEGGGSRWARVLAVPILAEQSGRVVGLHGLKRAL